MIDEHRLFIAAMSFLAAYFAILLIVATAAFVSHHHTLQQCHPRGELQSPDAE